MRAGGHGGSRCSRSACLRAWLAKVLSASGLCTFGPLCVCAGLIADGLQLGHTLLERRIGHASDAIFDGVVEALELGFRFGCTLAQFGNMRRPALVPPSLRNPG
jgi:hypothetical protein